MKTVLISSVALLAASTTNLFAADMLRGSIEPDVITTEQADADWSAIYIGAGVGFGSFSDEDERFPNFTSSGSGLGINAHVGFMRQIQDWVVGIEADYMYLDAEFTQLPPGFPELKVEDVFTLRGRVGYAYGNIQPYVTAGFAHARTNIKDLDGTGYVWGAGVDFKIAEHVMFGLQYQQHKYHDFGDQPIEVDHSVALARLSATF